MLSATEPELTVTLDEMTRHSPHELMNRQLPPRPDEAGMDHVTAAALCAYTDAGEQLINDLRETVAHLEQRVIEARIAMHAALQSQEDLFSRAWDESEAATPESGAGAEELFFRQDDNDHLEPARQWILADSK